jgi:hypothetical protein
MKLNRTQKKFLQYALALMFSEKPLQIELRWNATKEMYEPAHLWLGDPKDAPKSAAEEDFSDLVLAEFTKVYRKYCSCLQYTMKRKIIQKTAEISNLKKAHENHC